MDGPVFRYLIDFGHKLSLKSYVPNGPNLHILSSV